MNNFERKPKDMLTIEVTSMCNVKCVWCFMQTFNKIEKHHMSLNTFKNLIETNKDYIKENFVIAPFFRGEPLLNPDFWNMCKILKENEIDNVGVHSNFSMDIDIQALVETNIPIVVNIGGITKGVHEKVMINSNFEKVVSNLKKVYKANKMVHVKMNCTKYNVHQNKDLIDFVVSLGGTPNCVDEYTTTCPVPSHCTKEELEYYFNNVVSEDVLPFLRFNYSGSGGEMKTKPLIPRCNHLCDAIYYNGDYTICCQDQYGDLVVGNVFKSSIEKIRNSSQYKEAVRCGKNRMHKICGECC